MTLLLSVLLWGGCSDSAVREEMDLHWTDAQGIRDALVRGDLDRTRRRAMRMGDRLPMLGFARQRELVAAVTRIARAERLEDAASAVGAMAQACGNCHAEGDPGLTRASLTPPGGDGIADEMARHRWAADALWLGLVRPDDQDLLEAVSMLDGTSLAPWGTPADSPLSTSGAELEVRVHDLVGRVARADPSERGAAYGRLLATCASCHLVTRGPPE